MAGAKYVMALEAECGRLREQLDAARQALSEIAEAKPGGRGGQFAFRLQRIARAALGVVGEPEQRVTHGRHCPCGACAKEDWTRITAPCGMHGKDCPAVYAPLGVVGEQE